MLGEQNIPFPVPTKWCYIVDPKLAETSCVTMNMSFSTPQKKTLREDSLKFQCNAPKWLKTTKLSPSFGNYRIFIGFRAWPQEDF